MNDFQRARLTRWLYVTSHPIPYLTRTFLLDMLVGIHPARVEIPAIGIKLDLDLADILQANIYLDRVWDQKQSNWLAFFAARANTIVDAGAHIGYFTLLMARFARPGADIHAFEPNPCTFRQLQWNIEMNGVGVILNPLALAAGADHSQFSLPHRFQLGIARLGHLVSSHQSINVDTIALDDYCAEHRISAVDLIKMDIEGGESQAFIGMSSGIKANTYQTIMMDMHGTILPTSTVQAIYDQLRDANYYLYEVMSDRLAHLSEIKTGTDYHFCALSPKTYADLGSPSGDFFLPSDARLPFPIGVE